LRNLISGLTAALTALILGTLIAGAADAARAADVAKQEQVAQAIVADGSADQTFADATAYRAQLQEAIVKLNAAYADLAARDAAYRDLLAASQANVDRLQASNAQLQQQLRQAAARIQLAEARLAQAQTAATSTRRHDDD
jgi:chromosome segregation ATPase